MKLTKKICMLIADLEYCIGKECYNPNAYDGWNDIDGCEFRYPISFPNNDGTFTKVRTKLSNTPLIKSENITDGLIQYMKYKFGSNELFIGMGIINVLEYLEKRYNIDFNKLETNLKTKEESCEK